MYSYCVSPRGNLRGTQPGEELYWSSEVTEPDRERAREDLDWRRGGSATGSAVRNVMSGAAPEHDTLLCLMRSSAVRVELCARVPRTVELMEIKSSDRQDEEWLAAGDGALRAERDDPEDT